MIKPAIQLHDKTFELYIGYETLQQRIRQMATEIDSHYQGKEICFVAILNGVFMFAADLLKEVRTKSEIHFVKLSSYSGTESSGKVNELIGLTANLEGRHVILLEDIIDSGNTVYHFLPHLISLKPASFKVATLLFKPAALHHQLQIDYTGIEIPNDFIVGYGMDYNELGRNLKDIYVLKNTV